MFPGSARRHQFIVCLVERGAGGAGGDRSANDNCNKKRKLNKIIRGSTTSLDYLTHPIKIFKLREKSIIYFEISWNIKST